MRYGEGIEQKLMYAAQMAVTLGYSIVKQTDKVSLVTFDNRTRGIIPASNSMDQIVRMTQHLEEIEPQEKTEMADCLTEVASRMGRREIVMIFSDFFTDLAALEPVLQRLRFAQHEVVLFQVMHHDELYFDFDGMTKFLGLEVPEEILAQPEDLRTAYLAAVNRFNGELEAMAIRNGCERVLCDTRRNMRELFIDYLNRRSLLNRGR
jgi:uncharacterized protein (DUF58 family)